MLRALAYHQCGLSLISRLGVTYGLNLFEFVGCSDGTVVRALASHQCGPGSIFPDLASFVG